MKKFLKWALGLLVAASVAFSVVWFTNRELITNLFNEEVTETVEDTSETVVEAIDSLAKETVEEVKEVVE